MLLSMHGVLGRGVYVASMYCVGLGMLSSMDSILGRDGEVDVASMRGVGLWMLSSMHGVWCRYGDVMSMHGV